MPTRQIRRSRDALMGFMEPNIEKERPIGTSMLEPSDRFIGNQLTGVAVRLADRFTVANEVIRIVMRRVGVVPGRKPMIESMI